MDRITMPSALLSCLLLIPLRGQESCQKQVVIGHRGRSAIYYMRILLSILSICVLGGCVEVPLKKTKCEDQLTGTASIRDKNEFNEFVLIARRGDSVTNISFCGPK